MNRDEQGLIQNLFGKLADAERSAPPRDEGADRFIQDSVSRQPGAPYYMAQTIIMQEQALEAAQARIHALEAENASRPQASAGGGGFFGSLFGGGGASAARREPPRPAYGQQPGGQGYGAAQGGPWNGGAQGGAGYAQPGGYGAPQAGRMGGGGGFLAGAAQTAMGVAGGMMLGSMLSNAFGGDPAEAAAGAVADAGEAVQNEAQEFADAGGEDFGFDEEA